MLDIAIIDTTAKKSKKHAVCVLRTDGRQNLVSQNVVGYIFLDMQYFSSARVDRLGSYFSSLSLKLEVDIPLGGTREALEEC